MILVGQRTNIKFQKMRSSDEFWEEIENGFGVKDGGNGKLEFTGMKSIKINKEKGGKESFVYKLKKFVLKLKFEFCEVFIEDYILLRRTVLH